MQRTLSAAKAWQRHGSRLSPPEKPAGALMAILRICEDQSTSQSPELQEGLYAAIAIQDEKV